jgi:5-methylcytosine-specific restriction protein B
MSTNGKAAAMHPLNLILFGPPGTGKTYATMRHAVEICDGTAPGDETALRTRYRQLADEGRVAFVTFHQSFAYEDFVEGIRPVLSTPEDKEEQAVRFECRPGVFKDLCQRAHGTLKRPRKPFTFEPGSTRVWKMSLGNSTSSEDDYIYQECIDEGFIRLGYGMALDFTGKNTRAEVDALLSKPLPNASDRFAHTSMVHQLKNEMQTGDLVIVSDGNRRFRAIGRITGGYSLRRKDVDPEDHYRQMRPVEWLLVFEESRPADLILNGNFSQRSIYQLSPHKLKIEALQRLLATEEESSPQNHVLIIDEINRGNVSKILGELITLLEPDKRIGQDHELKVRLPYSGETFGVPSNLFVLGTMNTADRSIAFLDVALRRRFEFRELRPDPQVIRTLVGTNGIVEGFDVANLLEVLNARIEGVYDRDHTLGHAYLMKVKTLQDVRQVFHLRIVPLLEEYFFADPRKIAWVLGCPYKEESSGPLQSNPVPLMNAVRLKGPAMANGGDGLSEDRVRLEINPTFLTAAGNLQEYFRRAVEGPSQSTGA